MGKKKIGELYSTAICGNDISSSVLYVSALSIIAAGQYAWVALLIVAVVLFLFRRIYGEVVGALPLNGGAYNALLNTTSKSVASLAATLTMLSYMATAVISATEAMHYLHSILPVLPVLLATIGVLAFFMGLTIIGIGESAFVATIIFIFHLVSMIVLSFAIILFLSLHNGLDVFLVNWRHGPVHGSLWMAIFWGFAAAMLGISGFESSANFVEEQKKGVFPKTLRNMWIIVSIFNPLMAFLALSLVDLSQVSMHANDLLSYMGILVGGKWLSMLVSIDAVLVLSGAVLTSFIGVSGLVERITLDRILPGWLLKKNSRESSYRIIIMFFLLTVSILLITNGEVETLAGVYTISFLFVMGLFAIGNVLLKLRRKKLPRPEKASWLAVFIALIGVIIALTGNILKSPTPGQPSNFLIFIEYFIPAILLIAVMLNRVVLLKLLLNSVRHVFNILLGTLHGINRNILDTIDRINAQEFIFFTKGDNLSNLNKVMLYILRNEHTRHVKIVTVMGKDAPELISKLKHDLDFLDKEYPEIDIEFVKIKGEFSPGLIKELSEKWKIPTNFMFIGSPGTRFPYRIEELGGVRLII